MVEECEARPGLCKKLDLDHVLVQIMAPQMKRMPLDQPDSLLCMTAGSGSCRMLSVDSAGYMFNRHVEVEDACRGKYKSPSSNMHHYQKTSGSS